MTRYRSIVLITTALFFFGGIFWGLGESPFHRFNQPTKLTLICKSEWLSPAALHKVEEKLNVKFETTLFNNWSEYSRILANSHGSFDLLCTHSFLAKDLISSGWMDEYDYTSLGSYRGLSPEFLELPFDPKARFFIPLGWLLNGFAVEKGEDTELRWEKLWPASGAKISMNHPDLELFVRMRDEGFEMDPDKQGRYNTEPEAEVAKFMSTLGSLHPTTKTITKEDFKKDRIYQITNAQAGKILRDGSAEFKTLEDGSSIWFLLMGVGRDSSKKEFARQVLDEVLTPNFLNDFEKTRAFAHTLSHFNDVDTLPSELKANYVRQFPLASLKFPEVSLEGLPQWESYVMERLNEKKALK